MCVILLHLFCRYVDFQEMGGVKLKDLKTHTNAVGGAWGDDTWAALVRDNCEAILDTTEDAAAGYDDTHAKRALLIPISAFTSTQIMKIATLTGQTEDYKKFGVDEETPSGVEDIRNSTQQSGSSYSLVLSDVSSIQTPEEVDGLDIVFDELLRPSLENVLEDTRENDEIDDEEEVTINTTVAEEESCGDYINFSTNKPRLSKTMKAGNPTRNITIVESQDKTFFVCPCGFSSTNKSGSSRHKCRKEADVAFKCKDCDKVCKNPGSLKRHTQYVHRRQSVSLPAGAGHSEICPVINQSRVSLHECALCGKILATKKNLQSHIDKIHGQTFSASSTEPVVGASSTLGISRDMSL
jgi:hypothetical protein